MARKRITVYLPPDLQARVSRIAREQHRSESSVITAAVRFRWDREPKASTEEEPARRQLSRVDARLDKVVGEALILKEVMLLFVRVWFEHNPSLDEEIEESAAASAEARFERFLDFVAQGLAPGRSVTPGDHVLAQLSDIGVDAEGARS